jgi:hypothetical protein
MAPALVPGLVALSERARYFSLYSFLLARFAERQLELSEERLDSFIRYREWDMAGAVALCDNTAVCGSRHARSVVGRLKTFPAVARARAANQDALPRTRPIESRLGGYGLYYRTPMAALGLVARKGSQIAGSEKITPIDLLRPTDPLGSEIATAFAERIAGTAWGRDFIERDGPTEVPLAALAELSRAGCLCRLGDAQTERRLLGELLLERDSVVDPKTLPWRRRSFALFLECVGRDPGCFSSRGRFERAILQEAGDIGDDPGPRAETVGRWTALIAKETLQEGISGIFSELVRRGYERQHGDGISGTERDLLIAEGLVGSLTVELPGELLIDVRPEMASGELQELLVEASAAFDLEALRAWAATRDDAISGLCLLLWMASLEPVPGQGARAAYWSFSAIDGSAAFGLAHEMSALRGHLAGGPTVADTMGYLVERLVRTHLRIANSKLPEFTHRFLIEGGRLRFTHWARQHERIGRATNRQDVLALLSWDLGLVATGDLQRAVPTEAGRELVADVFGK